MEASTNNPVRVSPTQQAVLEDICRAQKVSKALYKRASVVLKAADGRTIDTIADELQMGERTVRRWRNRWRQAAERLEAAEGEQLSPKQWRALVVDILSDRPRPGCPPKFTEEEVALIIRLACEDPQDFGLPVSHWYPALLARQAVEEGIVESISPAQVGRFLKRS